MNKFGIWLGIGPDAGEFYIDEIKMDPEYVSKVKRLGLHHPDMRWEGTLIKSIFIDRKIKHVWPKIGSRVGGGSSRLWENYQDLFNTLREAKQALIKRAFR